MFMLQTELVAHECNFYDPVAVCSMNYV